MSGCKVGRLLATAPAGDQVVLARALSGELAHQGRTIPATTLAQALTATGHDVSATTVKDHRGHRCACATETADASRPNAQ